MFLMRHIGPFELLLQNNWLLCMLFHGGMEGDLSASLCIASCSDVLSSWKKACFVGENTENSEQVRWYT